MKLTIKQEKFCNAYIETGNASEAYRRAYSCKKMTEKQVWEESSKLLCSPKVTQRVEELQKELRESSNIKKDRLLEELANIAFSSIAAFHTTWTEKKDFKLLSDKEKATIKSIQTKILKKNIGTQEEPEIVEVEYVKIELHDKLKAIERICKMLGYDEALKVDLRKALLDISTGTDE